jgi:DNA-binding MarR family transcriptional regulator/GNAT superfamily N-acetyltransferase
VRSRKEAAEQQERIAGVRADARRIVRELGFIEQTLAGTPYPPSAVHALIEIDRASGITAAELADELLLDRSTVSRMLRKLVDAGEIREDQGAEDRRHKSLSLSDKGRQTVGKIHEYGSAQVRDAFAYLDEREQEAVRLGLHAYAEALVKKRRGTDPSASRGPQAIYVDTELRPGDIGQIVALHAHEYAKLAGFGVDFEALEAVDLGEFVKRSDRSSRIWVARNAAGIIVGSIAIDRSHQPDEAHLRWFLVGSGTRGTGLGRRLLRDALSYCDESGVAETVLWTFRGLDSARALYEQHGFVLVKEQPGSRWGNTVTEQQFLRSSPLGTETE